MNRPHPVAVAAIVVGLFGAGTAALAYQVLLGRYLARFVGNDHLATGLTLAVFLGGLALGYLLCGRLTLRVERHLRAYALFEAAIAVWALGLHRLVGLLEGLTASWSFAYPWGLLAQGLIVSTILVLPPTALMGATVPFLTRGLARAGAIPRVHALAYGVNTAGAAAGALLAGFVWIPRLGLPTTTHWMASINGAVALLFLLVSWSVRHPALVPEDIERDARETPRMSARRVYTMGALNGAAVLLFETVTIRVGRLVCGSSSSTISMVVAAFVLALATGSIAVGVSRRRPFGRGLFGVQVAAAATLLVLWPTIDLWPYAAHVVRIAFQPGTMGFALYHATLFACLLVVVGVPVALLGATLPLLYGELGADVSRSGSLSGRLLAWNGLGTVLGSLAGSFLLYRVLNIPRVWLLVPLVVVANAWLARPAAGDSRRAAPIGVAAVTVLSVLAWIVVPFYRADRLAIGTFRVREPLAYSLSGPATFYRNYVRGLSVTARDDDPAATVAVVETKSGDGVTSRSLFVNGRSESDTRIDAVTLRLSAHLPALFAPSRARAFVIGTGTGVTLGELARYDDLRQLVVAEISPAAVRFLPAFGEATGNVHLDPRLDVRIGDALLVLRQTREPFDLIVSEPSNPWVTGVGQLFTDRFYREVAEHLTADGLFLQWVQLYEMDFASLGIVLNTLSRTFPTLHAFHGSGHDLLLLAARRPITAQDARRARETLAGHPDVARALQDVGIDGYAAIVEREVQTLPTVLEESGPFGLNTADHPRLHDLAGRAMFDGSSVSDRMLRYGRIEVMPPS